MRALALSLAILFVAAPAFADEAVVVPDNNGRTVIREHGLIHDKTTIIDHSAPDAVVTPEGPDAVAVPEEPDEVSPNDGPSSGEVGVDVETHEHVPPGDD